MSFLESKFCPLASSDFVSYRDGMQNPATDPNLERLEFWAHRVCLESFDLFSPDEEEELREKFIQSGLSNLSIEGPIPQDFGPARDFQGKIEERFVLAYREECACNHVWADLLLDFALATPNERMIINLVLLRLSNESVYHLISKLSPNLDAGEILSANQ